MARWRDEAGIAYTRLCFTFRSFEETIMTSRLPQKIEHDIGIGLRGIGGLSAVI